MRVLRAGDGREIALEGPLLGRGGEASVYAVPHCPDLAAKVYHNPTAEQAAKLAVMLAAPPIPSPAPTCHEPLAWPTELLLDAEGERRVVGYLMPRVAHAHLLWEVFNPGARRQVCPQFHYGSLLRTARNLACVVRTLHEHGYVIGDLNESNVLVRPDALTTLIDVDSFQATAADRVYRCRVGRPEYTSPELQGPAFADVDRRPEHDAFALAVLVFQLLMQGTHPFAGTWTGDGEPDSIPARIAAGAWPYAWERSGPLRPSPHAPPWFVLPPAVQELLSCCFEDAHEAPSLRPSAALWQHALEHAEASLTPCAGNPQHIYVRGLDVCPWCAMAREQGRDPFPSMEELQARRHEAPSQAPAPTSPPSPRPAPIREDPPRSRSAPLREDPPRVRPAPVQAGPMKIGWAAAGLRRVGAALDRRSWVAWLGAALVGAVAGLLWALTHPPPPVEQAQAPRPSPSPPADPPQVALVPTPPDVAPADISWLRLAPAPAATAPGERDGDKADAPAPPPAPNPPMRDATPPQPPTIAPAQKAYEDALLAFRQTTRAYQQALLDYQAAQRDNKPVAGIQQDVAHWRQEWQAALRKLTEAQQALFRAMNSH
jgi:hypothetical protein